VLDATGTIVTELEADPPDKDAPGVVIAVPNCIGGSVGTGGIPGAMELVSGTDDVRECAPERFGSDTLRECPGCSRWMVSKLLIGLLGREALAELLSRAGFISKSSCELVELPELLTGETVPSPFASGSETRFVDTLLEDRLVREESITTLSTSLPFGDMLDAMSIEV
jgi:hypothetical protein